MKTKPCRNCNGTGKEPDQSFVGKEISALRKKAGLRQKRIAKSMGMSPSYFCDLENGNRFCSMALFREIQQAIRLLSKGIKSCSNKS